MTATRTQTIEPPPRTHALRRFRLRAIEGPDVGRAWTSSQARTVIGTQPPADVVLADATVSRFHCELELDGDRLIVRDLRSRNGTFVQGVEVREAVLEPGALLRCGKSTLRHERDGGGAEVALSEAARFGGLVGRSIAMRAVFALLEGAAPLPSPVLLVGEAGTGKATAAQALHDASGRAGPFLTVACGATPARELARELFGRESALEAARAGTVLLEDVGELPLDLQKQLHRALEGDDERARIVASTARDLRADVNARRFRSDLFFRLAVVEARLPPLRDRLDDLPVLVDALLERLGLGLTAADLGGATLLEELSRLRFPGNVGELRSYLERCVALGARAPLEMTNPELPTDPPVPLKIARQRSAEQFEKRYLERLLLLHEGNVSAAARTASIDRMHLYRLLWRHGLR